MAQAMPGAWDYFDRVLDIANLAVVVAAVWLTQKAARREDPVFEVRQSNYWAADSLHWFHVRVLNVGRRDSSILPIKGLWGGPHVLPTMVFVGSAPAGFSGSDFKNAMGRRQGLTMPIAASGQLVDLFLAVHADHFGDLQSAQLEVQPVYGKGAEVKLRATGF
ncbi:MAG TPA: hypothetical protein VM241_05550 [Candidatus Thermoplasmatota archaeon]|nr:hypothetical protein [Candidatus Thermoplasmatota archaeon]